MIRPSLAASTFPHVRSRLAVALILCVSLLGTGCPSSSGGGSSAAAPARSLDLSTIMPGAAGVLGLYGSDGYGGRGVPVSGGHDVDGDGNNDVALAAMTADPNGLTNAGEIYLHFGDGTIGGSVDTAVPEAMDVRISEVHGFKSADVLAYSADAGDHDGDRIDDLIVNEMLGDGILPADVDTGNLIVVSGALIRDLP